MATSAPDRSATMSAASVDPTVVLVHGAFADSSSWNGVIERLKGEGIPVMAAADPLRGLSNDSAYVARIFEQVPGPVIAVGHSYGGAVITNAASRVRNVIGLVFVAAFAPDEGERLGEAAATSKDSVLMSVLSPRRYPSASGGDVVEFIVDPARFHDAFAADLPVEVTELMAVTQRPVSELAFSEATAAPAWRDLPSWAIVATADLAAGTDLIRSMNERARARVTEVDASHVVMLSQPDAVSDVILEAVREAVALPAPR